MANTPGAIKRIRQTARKKADNRPHLVGMRTAIKHFEHAVENGADNIDESLQQAISAIDRAVTKGVVHKNKANRDKARLHRLHQQA